DEHHDHFRGGLELAGPPGREALRDFPEHNAENEAEHDRPRHRVDVERPEVAPADGRILGAIPSPLTFDAAHLKVGEMVLDVFAGGFPVTARLVSRHSSALRHFFDVAPVSPTSSAPNTTSCAAMKPANTAGGASGRTKPKITPNANAVRKILPTSPIQ